jgi:hypothetical protein
MAVAKSKAQLAKPDVMHMEDPPGRVKVSLFGTVDFSGQGA